VKELSSGSRSGVILRDNPLHVDHINRFWDRFSAAMRDKDLAIQAELSRQVFRAPHYKISHIILHIISLSAGDSNAAGANAVCRLERLQALADKLSTDCRTCENHIDSLSRRLAEVLFMHHCLLTLLDLFGAASVIVHGLRDGLH